MSWLLEAASPPIQYRAYTEVVPESARDPERLGALRQALLAYKIPREILRRQKSTGLWGTNLLGPAASKTHGWTEVGTVYQYRRLLELGWPPEDRAFRLADRWLFQILSRITIETSAGAQLFERGAPISSGLCLACCRD